jgi:hypothetical protein
MVWGGILCGAPAAPPPVPPAAAPSQAQVSPSQPAPRQNPASEPQAAVNLRLIATPGVTLSTPDRGTHDFGKVGLLDKMKIEQTFTLRNEGQTPLTLERVKTSCGCSSAVVRTAPKADSNAAASTSSPGALPTLAPGEEASLRLEVDLTYLAPGAIRKNAMVYVQGNSLPVATAEITGTLLPTVTFTPALVNLDRVVAGKEQSLLVTAVFDARLAAAGGALPALVSSHPHLRVTEENAPAATPAAPPHVTEPDAARPTFTRTYRLSVAQDIPIGPLTGALSFGAPNSAPPDALKSARVALVGQVVGDVAAQPQALAMGMVPRDRETTQELVLTGVNAAALENLKINSDSTYLSARLDTAAASAATTSAPGAARTLVVTLTPGMPAGALQTQLNVTLANGRRLIIPVNAYVRP